MPYCFSRIWNYQTQYTELGCNTVPGSITIDPNPALETGQRSLPAESEATTVSLPSDQPTATGNGQGNGNGNGISVNGNTQLNDNGNTIITYDEGGASILRDRLAHDFPLFLAGLAISLLLALWEMT
jgi:hypothetical protein